MESGDLIRRRTEAVAKANGHEKLIVNWEGPHVMKEQVNLGLYGLIML